MSSPAPPLPPPAVPPSVVSVPQDTTVGTVENSKINGTAVSPPKFSNNNNNITTLDRSMPTDSSTVGVALITTSYERLGEPLATPRENILQRTSSHQIHTNLKRSHSKQNVDTLTPISKIPSLQQKQKMETAVSQEQYHQRQQLGHKQAISKEHQHQQKEHNTEEKSTISQPLSQQRSRSSRNRETTRIAKEPSQQQRRQRSRSSSPTYHKHHHRRTSKTRKEHTSSTYNNDTKHPQQQSKEIYPSSFCTSSSSSNSDADEGDQRRVRQHQHPPRQRGRKSEKPNIVNNRSSQEQHQGRQQRLLDTQRLKEDEERFGHPGTINNDRDSQDQCPLNSKSSVTIDITSKNISNDAPSTPTTVGGKRQKFVGYDQAVDDHHPPEAVKKSAVNNTNNDLSPLNISGYEQNNHSEEDESSEATIILGERNSLSGSSSEDTFARAFGPATRKSSGLNSGQGLTTAKSAAGDNRPGLLSCITGKPLTIEEKVGMMRNPNNPGAPVSGVRQQNQTGGNIQPNQPSEVVVGSSSGDGKSRNPYRRQGGHREKTRPTHEQQHEQFTGNSHYPYHSPTGSQHNLNGVGCVSPPGSNHSSNHTLGSHVSYSHSSASGSDNDDMSAHLRHLKGYAAVMKSPARYPNPNKKKEHPNKNDRSQDIAMAMQMHREVSLYADPVPQQNAASPVLGSHQHAHSSPGHKQVVDGRDIVSTVSSGRQQYQQSQSNDHFDNHHNYLSDFRSTLRSRRGQGGPTVSPPATTNNGQTQQNAQQYQMLTSQAPQQSATQQEPMPHSATTRHAKSSRRRYPTISTPTATTFSAASSPPPLPKGGGGGYRHSPQQPPPKLSDLETTKSPATADRRVRLFSDQTTSRSATTGGDYSQQQQNRKYVAASPGAASVSQRTRLFSDQTAMASSQRAQKVL